MEETSQDTGGKEAMKVILYEVDGVLMTREEFRAKMFRAKPNRTWNNQGSYRKAMGQAIAALRQNWFCDINKDKPQHRPHPLIHWSGPCRG